MASENNSKTALQSELKTIKEQLNLMAGMVSSRL